MVQRVKPWVHLYREMGEAFKSTSQKQLEARMGPLEKDIDTLEDRRKGDGISTPSPWYTNAKIMLQCTRQAIDEHDIQRGWDYYYQAELYQLHLLDAGELAARAETILENAEEVLSDSKKRTIRSLIAVPGQDGVWKVSPTAAKDVSVIAEARKVIQTHWSDKYTDLRTVLKQLFILSTIAVALTFIAIIFLEKAPDYIDVKNGYFLGCITIFGALGGTASGASKIGQALDKSTPERTLNSWLTISRPIFGAVNSLAILTFILGGLIQAGILPNTPLTPTLVFAFCFITGFSERLITDTIAGVESRKSS